MEGSEAESASPSIGEPEGEIGCLKRDNAILWEERETSKSPETVLGETIMEDRFIADHTRKYPVARIFQVIGLPKVATMFGVPTH